MTTDSDLNAPANKSFVEISAALTAAYEKAAERLRIAVIEETSARAALEEIAKTVNSKHGKRVKIKDTPYNVVKTAGGRVSLRKCHLVIKKSPQDV